MKIALILFLFFNLITFLVFGYDKYLARTNRRRIREKTLITLAAMGGSVGAVFAQRIFRHKRQKYPYLFWIILIVQFLIYEGMWLYSTNTIDNFLLKL